MHGQGREERRARATLRGGSACLAVTGRSRSVSMGQAMRRPIGHAAERLRGFK
jgi:hypothetical protein